MTDLEYLEYLESEANDSFADYFKQKFLLICFILSCITTLVLTVILTIELNILLRISTYLVLIVLSYKCLCILDIYWYKVKKLKEVYKKQYVLYLIKKEEFKNIQDNNKKWQIPLQKSKNE